MSDTPYIPIACGDYDIYEIAIMQNRMLTLTLSESLNDHTVVRVKPLALEIESGAEYLKYSLPVAGEKLVKNTEKVRLDKIIKAEMIKT